MTMALSQLVDLEVTRYYHCICRWVRRAFLCGEGFKHRKQWIEDSRMAFCRELNALKKVRSELKELE